MAGPLPTIAISSDKLSLKAGETAKLTFKLSAPSTDFSAGDISVFRGTLSNFGRSGTDYTATFTPLPNSSAPASISVASYRFSNAMGLLNEDGLDADNSVTIAVDTKDNPILPGRVVPLDEQIERVAEFGAFAEYRLSGPDRNFFTITPGGTLKFRKAPDYERPYDQGNDNTYDITVTGYQGGGVSSVEDLHIKIQEVYITKGDNSSSLMITGRSGYLQILQDTRFNDRLTGGDCLDKFLITGGADTIVDFNYRGANKDWYGKPAPSGQEVLRVSEGANAVVYVRTSWTATSESLNAGSINFNTPGKALDLTEMSVVTGVKILNTRGAARLTGSAAGDTITGGSGKDSIYGGFGADRLLGGSGNDALSGDSGQDTLDGGGGADTLVGGSGADWFLFGTTLGASNVDRIKDFVTGTDKIVLSAKIFSMFTGSSAGTAITAGNLVVGAGTTAKAADSNDYLTYDTGTDMLYYDADGIGPRAPVAFVKIELTGTATPTFGDFLVVS
jgi:Ca2+-binding RTX toxin-like protein